MEQQTNLHYTKTPYHNLLRNNSTVLERKRENDLKKPDLLLIENEVDLDSVMSNGLSGSFRIHTVKSGHKSIEMARKIMPEIILSDVKIPDMEIRELGQILRNNPITSHIPLVFLTRKSLWIDEIELLSTGAIDCFYWPFNLLSIKMKLFNIIENNRRIRKKAGMLESFKSPDINLPSPEEEFIEKVIASIDKHIDETDFDVEKLSEYLFLTPNQTYRKIKAITGSTAKEFIRIHRLKTAANLLIQRKRNISEIVYMMGFSTPSYFSKCFKEQYGCSPSEFIERNTSG